VNGLVGEVLQQISLAISNFISVIGSAITTTILKREVFNVIFAFLVSVQRRYVISVY
jgi:hypothetical protein